MTSDATLNPLLLTNQQKDCPKVCLKMTKTGQYFIIVVLADEFKKAKEKAAACLPRSQGRVKVNFDGALDGRNGAGNGGTGLIMRDHVAFVLAAKVKHVSHVFLTLLWWRP